jgi:hypothetical protein
MRPAKGETVSKNMKWTNTTIRTLPGEPLIALADGQPVKRCFATEQMDEGWSENLQRRHPHLWRDPKRLELRRNLLRFGGSEVFLAPQEPYLDMLVSERAIVWDGTASKRLRGGEPHRCHSNVAHRYERQMRRRWRIATGYALAGSLWVQHSWLCGDKSIGETTVQFLAYAGIVLDDVESVVFWLQTREKPWPFPEPPPPALQFDDPHIVEGVMRAFAKHRTETSVRPAIDAHVIELQDTDHVSQHRLDCSRPRQLVAE